MRLSRSGSRIADLISVNFQGFKNVIALRSKWESCALSSFDEVHGQPEKGVDMNAKVAVLAVLFLLVPSVPVKAKKIPPRPFFLQTQHQSVTASV